MNELLLLALTAILACGLLFIPPALAARRGDKGGKPAFGVMRAFGAVCLSGILAIGNVAFAGTPASAIGEPGKPAFAIGERQAADWRIDIAYNWEEQYKKECTGHWCAQRDDRDKHELNKKRGGHGWTYLHEVTWRDQTRQIKRLIKLGADVNSKTTQRGWTPLHIAAERGHTQNMRVLIIKRANINARDNEGKTPLHIAAQVGNLDAVSMLLHERAAVSARDNMGRTAFHLAAKVKTAGGGDDQTRTRILNKLHKAGANVNSQDIDGKTAMHFAAENDNASLVSHLFNVNRADKNLEDDNGFNALVHAAMNGHSRTADVLMKSIKLNKSVLKKNGVNGMGPLHYAASNNNRPAVKLLIKLGVDVNAKDKGGRSALHYAADRDSPGAIGELLDNGADKHAKANWHYEGFTPLHVAAYRNSRKAASVLLDYGVNKWEKDTLDKPAYEYARHYHGDWSKIACYTWPHKAWGDEDCSKRHD